MCRFGKMSSRLACFTEKFYGGRIRTKSADSWQMGCDHHPIRIDRTHTDDSNWPDWAAESLPPGTTALCLYEFSLRRPSTYFPPCHNTIRQNGQCSNLSDAGLMSLTTLKQRCLPRRLLPCLAAKDAEEDGVL